MENEKSMEYDMTVKIIYVIVYFAAIISIFFFYRLFNRISDSYVRSLKKSMIYSVIAITGNILIALSGTEQSAGLAYCIYFSSIDWILFYFFGFILSYTEHNDIKRKLKIPIAALMGADTLSIFINLILRHQFYIYENTDYPGTVFFQTGFRFPYYLHLSLDYVIIVLSLSILIHRIFISHSLYRTRYVMIFSILLLIVFLNIIYMTLDLVLDASVIFYGVEYALIYFSLRIFVPRTLMMTSIGRAVDDMNEGLILFDIYDNCIYANSFAQKYFNIDTESYNYESEPVATVMNEVIKGKTTAEYIIVPDSSNKTEPKHFNIKYNKLTDRHDHLIGVYFLIEDTTETVFYMNEIQDARISADKANKAKSTFLANMSHEIRTPLNSILGMNELILRGTDDPHIREYAENISSAGEALLGIINDVLDFSKIEAGRTEVIETNYNPYKLLRDCYFFFVQTAHQKDLYIHITCDETLPSELFGDSKLIGQILTNIVSNALKYTKEGGVALDMTYDRTLSKDEVELIVKVSDTGIGIAAEDIPHLFDSFKRVNEIQNATIQGTGLGLAITKDLVTLMNGDIRVQSTPGQGSTFIVNIPQKVVDHTPIGPLVNPKPLNTTVHKESFTAPDAHILIVDDVHVNLMVAEGLLKPTKVNIDKAGSGDEAIEKCKAIKYDLILLDHRMPDKDGIETFREISSGGLNSQTPVIMLTANAISGMDEEYRAIGFADYLTKPVKVAELETALLKLLPKDKIITS